MDDKAVELAKAVLVWWQEVEYDTVMSGDGEEYNVYDRKPEFVLIAQKIMSQAQRE